MKIPKFRSKVHTEPPEVEVRLARTSSTIGQYQVKDHFSLNAPSSAVAFKDVECHIFQDGTEQLVLEKEGTTITAKKASESTPGLFFMRLFYTVVSLLMAGFLFIFSIQVVLFLFLGVLKASGSGSRAFQFGKRLLRCSFTMNILHNSSNC